MTSPTRRALVVGGTSGIGHGIALALARRGDISVTIAGRSATRGAEIVQELSQLSDDADKNSKHKFESINAFDLSSLKDLAEKESKEGENVDLLVMTQGMATVQGYTPTNDGLDQKLQLHYFSRIYLSCLLAPHMKPGSRILTVLSAGVHNRYKHFQEDFELKKKYSIKNAADAAGFYTDAGFEQLAETYPNLIVAHACPGFVNTNWGTEMPWLVRQTIRPLQRMFGTSLRECGETLTKAWLDGIPADGGYSLIDQNGAILGKDSMRHTKEERDVVWEKTLEVLPEL